MAHHVYANGHEIASRSSDGQSNAMGDVCFTPPTPPTPGVPIPYPNTVFGKDIRNGSRTVFIAGKEVALSNKSYFHKSIGDTGATKALKKGIISGNVEGRGFFTAWSMNVKIEGEGVARDMDKVTHNHSNPANTALFPFLSRSARGSHACKDEEKRIKKACDETDPNDKNASRMPKKKFRSSPNPPTKKMEGTPDAHWSKKHCSGILNVPNNTGGVDDALASIDKELEDLHQYLGELDKFGNIIKAEVEQWAIEKGAKLAAKAVAKQAVGSFVPLAGNIVMGLTSVYDGAQFASELASKRTEIIDLIDNVKSLDKGIQEASQIQDRLKAIKNGNPMEINGQKDSPAKVLGDMQAVMADTSPCLRARKCSLVPYDTKAHTKGTNVESSTGTGCCPGQTGHHLIPGSIIDTKKKDGTPRTDGLGCENYNHKAAPTVCVESANKDAGSHKRAHDAFDKALKNRVDESANPSLWTKATGGPAVQNGAMDMDETIKAAAESHQEAFPLSRCSKRCIEAQLKDYYNKNCRKAKVRVTNQNGNPVTPDEGIE